MSKKLLLCLAVLCSGSAAVASEVTLRETPCRLFDSRNIGGVGQGSKIDEATIATFNDAGPTQGGESGCGVPATASGVVLNLTVYQPESGGWARLWAYGETEPVSTSTNVTNGQLNEATGLMVNLGDGGRIALNASISSAHYIIDLAGFLDGPGSAEDHGGYLSTAPRFFRALSFLNAPMASPSVGDRFIVSDSGTAGVFVGRENDIVWWDGSAWAFEEPQEGDLAFVSALSGLWSFRALGFFAWREVAFEP